MPHRQRLSQKRILIVEDQWATAKFMRDVLETAGAVVVGLAANSREAIQVLEGTGVEAVILDIHLLGSTSHMVAHLLEMRGIPYLFATGHSQDTATISPDVTVLRKPFTDGQLLEAVETLLNGPRAGQRPTALS
jgi:CheY-like chemotaxis protein